ncbi:Na+/H+ antiporter subunit B [Thermodesulfobacteriota bacterium]
MPSLILKTATRLLAGLIIVFSVYLLVRGHHAPGGGFAAALTAATAFALLTISEGVASLRKALRVDPRTISMCGLGIAVFSGVISVLAGRPFLTGIWFRVGAESGIPVMLGSPLLFDIGVCLVVLGTILTLILALEEEIR